MHRSTYTTLVWMFVGLVACNVPSCGVDTATIAREWQLRRGRDPGPAIAGKWREVRDDMRLTDEQREEIRRLDAIGYADGTLEIAAATEAVPVYDPQAAYDGVNLYNSGHAAEAFLVDMHGQVLHQWSTSFHALFGDVARQGGPGTTHFRRVKLGPDGALYVIFEGQGIGRLDREGRVVWAVHNGAHHDLTFDPQGHVVVITRHSGFHDTLSPDKPILADAIVTLDAQTGEEIGRIELLDAFLDGGFPEIVQPRNKRRRTGDLLHTNSIERLDGRAARCDPAMSEGRYLISMRSPSAIAVVDPTTSKVVWAHKGIWAFQHEASLWPDSCHLLMFDNAGAGHQQSRVLSLELPSLAVAWSWQGSPETPLWSATLGTVHVLPNSDLLVTESEAGRAFEITWPDARVVWAFHNPHRAGDDGRYIAALFDVSRFSRSDPRIVAVLGPEDAAPPQAQ